MVSTSLRRSSSSTTIARMRNKLARCNLLRATESSFAVCYYYLGVTGSVILQGLEAEKPKWTCPLQLVAFSYLQTYTHVITIYSRYRVMPRVNFKSLFMLFTGNRPIRTLPILYHLTQMINNRSERISGDVMKRSNFLRESTFPTVLTYFALWFQFTAAWKPSVAIFWMDSTFCSSFAIPIYSCHLRSEW